MDPLFLTVLIVFCLTVLGTILQRRAKDPCLKKFRDCHVVLQLKSGKWIWGSLEVYSKSLELCYDKPNPDPAGHHELTYIFFEDQLPDIKIVLRPLPPEGTVKSHRWKKDLKKLISPSIWFEFRRSLRNLWNTLRDAFSQAIGAAVVMYRTKNPASAAMSGGADQKISSTGQMIVSYGNNAYEPILEKYLGKEVIVETLIGDKWIEQLGILEEYSDKYILLRDAKLEPEIPIPDTANFSRHVDVIFSRAHSVVRHLGVRTTR
jgi:hypothetical protein